jgi:hypothetical protein
MVDQDYVGSPLDIHIECAIGTLLCLLGCVSCADDFEPIRLAQTFHRYALPVASAPDCLPPRAAISLSNRARSS